MSRQSSVNVLSKQTKRMNPTKNIQTVVFVFLQQQAPLGRRTYVKKKMSRRRFLSTKDGLTDPDMELQRFVVERSNHGKRCQRTVGSCRCVWIDRIPTNIYRLGGCCVVNCVYQTTHAVGVPSFGSFGEYKFILPMW